MNQPQRVRDVGEQELLRRLQKFCPAEIIGDDAALLSIREGYLLVVTSDTLVDGVHFSLGLADPTVRTTSAYDAGWRAATANLSDLAAMGASPLGITVGLGLPGEVLVADVEELYQGMVDCLQPFNTPIVGGDICRSPVISLNITALGQVLPHRAIRRSTAQPGDAILITGVHGASRAGLALLLDPKLGQGLRASDRASLICAHQRPQPRLDVIPLLATFPVTGAVTGMDSSDGLADAVLQICRASQVGARLDRTQIPLPGGLTDWISIEQALEWALYGGEDFELVLCLPQTIAADLLESLGKGAAIVGRITAEPSVILQDGTGQHPDELLTSIEDFSILVSGLAWYR
ncbi:MAG: thiamine-phosphate kinase [Leptolyngbyaceae cyanobacterium CRU_2_3]|nr:thiamine-phosphate kinase [Leptolyngbyaceae cyanobacterium CRU_2_3]